MLFSVWFGIFKSNNLIFFVFSIIVTVIHVKINYSFVAKQFCHDFAAKSPVISLSGNTPLNKVNWKHQTVNIFLRTFNGLYYQAFPITQVSLKLKTVFYSWTTTGLLKSSTLKNYRMLLFFFLLSHMLL